jgi:hypothetical protein
MRLGIATKRNRIEFLKFMLMRLNFSDLRSAFFNARVNWVLRGSARMMGRRSYVCGLRGFAGCVLVPFANGGVL